MSQPETLAEMVALAGRAMKRIAVGESGGWLPAADVHVRDYPFPYCSALALSNDCDSQHVACNLDWHAFVNGRGPTAYGDGLGLEVGDSFWVYSNGFEPGLFKGNPFDADHVPGYAADWIVELARLGWLDTLHSFGNWTMRLVPAERVSDPAIFARDQIAKGLDRLDQLGLKPTVYVNHSGSPSNVGGPWGWYQKADDPAHSLYSLDLLTDFGFRFFWIDSCTDIDKFGNDWHFADEDDLQRRLARFGMGPWLRRRNAEGQMSPIPVPQDEAGLQAMLVDFFNRSQFPVQARDGRMIHAFKRYRDIDQPVGSTFPAQVTAEKLDELEARRGNVVIYQHFGVFGPRGRSPVVSRPHRTRSPVPALDVHSAATWRMIAERHESGRLFVATQGRLLDWIWRRGALQLSVERQPGRWTITLDGFACPVQGRRPVEDADLNGLALVIPASAPEVVVVRPGRTGGVALRRSPEAGDPEAHVLHAAWHALEWPEGIQPVAYKR